MKKDDVAKYLNKNIPWMLPVAGLIFNAGLIIASFRSDMSSLKDGQKNLTDSVSAIRSDLRDQKDLTLRIKTARDSEQLAQNKEIDSIKSALQHHRHVWGDIYAEPSNKPKKR